MEFMCQEIDSRELRDHWTSMKRTELCNTKTIFAICVFNMKRYPFGDVDKYKARICAHGGIQQWRVNYWETCTCGILDKCQSITYNFHYSKSSYKID